MVFATFGCETPDLKRTGESRIGRPDAESWDDIITLTNEGAKRAVIRSGHLEKYNDCLLYTSPSPRDLSTSRMPSSA